LPEEHSAASALPDTKFAADNLKYSHDYDPSEGAKIPSASVAAFGHGYGAAGEFTY
jgi:hypothetical protein